MPHDETIPRPFSGVVASLDLTIHPAADLFPMLAEPQLRELASDIEANGLIEPIVVFRDQLIDGRNRLAALALLDLVDEVEPREWEGDEGGVVRWIISKNIHRRHLTTSQRALVAAELAEMTHGGDRRSSGKLAACSVPTQGEAARMLDVGERSVRDARVVIEKGDEELKDAVRSGEVSVSAAAKQLRPPKPSVSEEIVEGEPTPHIGVDQAIEVVRRVLEEVQAKGGRFHDLRVPDPIARGWVSHELGSLMSDVDWQAVLDVGAGANSWEYDHVAGHIWLAPLTDGVDDDLPTPEQDAQAVAEALERLHGHPEILREALGGDATAAVRAATRAPRKDNDAYYTPPELARAILEKTHFLGMDGLTVLEPSVGAGAFAMAAIGKCAEDITGLDIDPEAPFIEHWPDNAGVDFLTWEPDQEYDVVLGNPPYKDAEAHVRKAMEVVKPGGEVVFLLRLGFLGSMGRRELFRDAALEQLRVIRPRPSFTDDGGTDGSEYAVFVWRKWNEELNGAPRNITIGREAPWKGGWIDWVPGSEL